MKIGIVGLPNVGKSTLFKALTKKDVDIQNYPFCTIDPNIGVVTVPDERLDVLANISKSKKVIPAIVEFFDIAGLVKGAHQGEGLGNKFLSNIRETDAIVHVVRVFEDQNIIHVDNKIDPLKDIEIINLELIMADLEVIRKHIEKIERDVKRGDEKAILMKENLTILANWLEQGKPARFFENFKDLDIDNLNLLSAKPIIYVLNKKAGGKNIEIDLLNKNQNENVISLDINLELEMQSLSREDMVEYRKSIGLMEKESLLELIKLSYKTLGLITFFTTGEDETRAWTIRNSALAPEAGAVIHTDFEKKFIKAQVISYNDFINSGLVRTEGKEYLVKDGDIIEFKISI